MNLLPQWRDFPSPRVRTREKKTLKIKERALPIFSPHTNRVAAQLKLAKSLTTRDISKSLAKCLRSKARRNAQALELRSRNQLTPS
jgi:hypothetical protein